MRCSQPIGAEVVILEITIDRRSFLVSVGLLGIGTADGAGPFVGSATAAPPADVEAFHALSSFLTGTPDLDLDLAGRALAQLSALDPDFGQKVARLAEIVRSAGAANMDAFLAAPASSDKTVRETTTTIVSAWYLGFTGTPIPLRAEDDTGFVTFLQARMYEPTLDATVRPTYARAGTDYWVDPPPFVTAPPGPPGLKSWGSASPKGTGTIPGAANAEPNAEPATPGAARTEP
jgi:hypothetical protein